MVIACGAGTRCSQPALHSSVGEPAAGTCWLLRLVSSSSCWLKEKPCLTPSRGAAGDGYIYR
eukprot:scaffold324_cov394-Prasinococcus_capsulatus_cf.AAC.36